MEEVRKDIPGGGGYQFPEAPVINYLQVGGLKPQKLTLSQFWRLGVQTQGVG